MPDSNSRCPPEQLRQPNKRKASADVFTFIKPWALYFPCEENSGSGGPRFYSSSLLIIAGKHRGCHPSAERGRRACPLNCTRAFWWGPVSIFTSAESKWWARQRWRRVLWSSRIFTEDARHEKGPVIHFLFSTPLISHSACWKCPLPLLASSAVLQDESYLFGNLQSQKARKTLLSAIMCSNSQRVVSLSVYVQHPLVWESQGYDRFHMKWSRCITYITCN